jgi:SAM-dependent methyltransferase
MKNSLEHTAGGSNRQDTPESLASIKQADDFAEHCADKLLEAEFDRLADDYYDQHKENVAIMGESPEYFHEYKVVELAELVVKSKMAVKNILDFGSGIGNSVPYFRKCFPYAELCCADVSTRSIEVAQGRFPGKEKYVVIDKGRIPLESGSQDVVFSAGVFHHIPHEEHRSWLAEMRRVTRPDGLLAIYEHNPLNPLTAHAVNTCALDVNACLIRGGTLRRCAQASGWEDVRVDYRLFFPAMLRLLRPLEKHLGWLVLGAQYRMTARKRT